MMGSVARFERLLAAPVAAGGPEQRLPTGHDVAQAWALGAPLYDAVVVLAMAGQGRPAQYQAGLKRAWAFVMLARRRVGQGCELERGARIGPRRLISPNTAADALGLTGPARDALAQIRAASIARDGLELIERLDSALVALHDAICRAEVRS